MEEGFTGGPVTIVRAGASIVLRSPAQEVPEAMLGSEELRNLVNTMIETMRAAPGVGLAAPQIGVGLQVRPAAAAAAVWPGPAWLFALPLGCSVQLAYSS